MKSKNSAYLNPDSQHSTSITPAHRCWSLPEKLELLFAQGPLAYLISMINACILTGIMWPLFSARLLLGWLAISCLISLARALLAYCYLRTSRPNLKPQTWYELFLFGTVCAGMTWGSAGWLFFPANAQLHQLVLIFVLAGMTVAAVPVLAPSRPAFWLFSILTLGPLIARFLVDPEPTSIVMGSMGLLYIAGLANSAQTIQKSMQESIAMRHANTDLLQQVKQINRDLSAEVQSHQQDLNALRTSEQRLRDFADTAADWYWEINAELRIEYLSKRFYHVTGLSQDKVIGKNLQHIIGKLGRAHNNALQNCLSALAARSAFQDNEFHISAADQTLNVISISGKPIFDAQGVFAGYRGTGRNITRTYKAQQKLNTQITHDMLTGLVNRAHFEYRLSQALDNARSYNSQHALCYINIDQFRRINTSFGHQAGDALLCEVANLISATIRQGDVLARLGGDEFALLLMGCSQEQAATIAYIICNKFEEFCFYWEHQQLSISLNIGITTINTATHSIQWALSSAEVACTTAQQQGRNCVHRAPSNDADLHRRRQEANRIAQLEQALFEDQFQLYYQPIQPLNPSNTASHYEILLRLEDGVGGLISPQYFLPIAERHNIAPQIDRWVIETLFRWLQGQQLTQGTLYTINLSGQTLSNISFAQFVQDLLERYSIRPEHICFEITETATISSLHNACLILNQLRALGCSFALDDFGSGLSSFAYLKNLEVDYLKIDGLFVRDIGQNPMDRTIVQSIHDIGHALGKKTVAEQVEDAAVLQILKQIGLDYAQGYYIGKPQPLPLDKPLSKRPDLRLVASQ